MLILITAGLIQAQYHYGWGRHQQYVSLPNATLAAKYNTIMAAFGRFQIRRKDGTFSDLLPGIMGPTFARMSFIVLMTNLFGNSTWRRKLLWVLFWIQLVANSAVSITTYVQCADIRSQWNFAIISKCWPATTEQVSSSRSSRAPLFLLTLKLVHWIRAFDIQWGYGLVFNCSSRFDALEAADDHKDQARIGISVMLKFPVSCACPFHPQTR